MINLMAMPSLMQALTADLMDIAAVSTDLEAMVSAVTSAAATNRATRRAISRAISNSRIKVEASTKSGSTHVDAMTSRFM